MESSPTLSSGRVVCRLLKHKAPFETRSQLCYCKSQFRPCFWCRSVYFHAQWMRAALHAGCGTLLSDSGLRFSKAAQEGSADCPASRLVVLINIWLEKKTLIQKQERVCKNGPLCDSVARHGGWSEWVLLWQVTH